MLLDILNSFTHIESTGVDEQAITVDADSTNIIDLGAQDNQPWGSELYLHIKVGPDAFGMAATDDGTLDITLVTDDVLSSGDLVADNVILTLAQVAQATLIADYQICHVRVPNNTQRYLKLVFNVTATGNAFNAGAIQAFLTPSVQDTYAVS